MIHLHRLACSDWLGISQLFCMWQYFCMWHVCMFVNQQPTLCCYLRKETHTMQEFWNALGNPQDSSTSHKGLWICFWKGKTTFCLKTSLKPASHIKNFSYITGCLSKTQRANHQEPHIRMLRLIQSIRSLVIKSTLNPMTKILNKGGIVKISKL